MLRFDPFGDGYTEQGYIAEMSGRHAALRFAFRPALVEESRRLRDAASTIEGAAYDRQAALFAAAKIVDLDLAGPSGPITAHALLRLPSELFVRMFQIVAGWSSSDIDPAWPAERFERTRELDLAATQTGRSVGEVREERDERSLILGVNLQLFHPALLNRSCQSCQTWMYDDQHRRIRRLDQAVRRPANSPTPCWKCPKRSPAHAAGCERDAARIRATLQILLDVRATRGRSLSDRQASDALLVRHLSLVDLIVRRWEARKLQRGVPGADRGVDVRRTAGTRR